MFLAVFKIQTAKKKGSGIPEPFQLTDKTGRGGEI
jgi:hypothetical protein